MKTMNFVGAIIGINMALQVQPIVGMEYLEQERAEIRSPYSHIPNDGGYFCVYLDKSPLLSLRLVDTNSLQRVETECQRRINTDPDLALSTVVVHTHPNSKTALYIVRKRAEEYYQLGLYCWQYIMQNPHVSLGYADTKRHLHWATQAGHADAQLVLGVIFQKEGGKENLESAKNCFHMSADKGNIDAQWRIGQIFYGEGKFKEAQTYFKLAADKGNTLSQYNLGFLYQEEKNPDQAKAYYQMAIDQGDVTDPAVVRACVNLGNIHKDEGNKDLAKLCWEKAAAQGNVNAKKGLDSLIDQGDQEKEKKL